MVCDCNSDPANSNVPSGDSVPKSAAYQQITGEGRFGDLWLGGDFRADGAKGKLVRVESVAAVLTCTP
jgi:hypothetical protein